MKFDEQEQSRIALSYYERHEQGRLAEAQRFIELHTSVHRHDVFEQELPPLELPFWSKGNAGKTYRWEIK